MGYILKRLEDGKYVARPGSQHSYTKLLQQARVFNTRDEAEGNRCGNERITTVDEEMGRD